MSTNQSSFSSIYAWHLSRIADVRRRLPDNYKGIDADIEVEVAILSNEGLAVQMLEKSSSRIHHVLLDPDYKAGELLREVNQFMSHRSGAVRFEDSMLSDINDDAQELNLEPFDGLLSCYVASKLMAQGEVAFIIKQFTL